MRAKQVYEFTRGSDPLKTLGIGYIAKIIEGAIYGKDISNLVKDKSEKSLMTFIENNLIGQINEDYIDGLLNELSDSLWSQLNIYLNAKDCEYFYWLYNLLGEDRIQIVPLQTENVANLPEKFDTTEPWSKHRTLRNIQIQDYLYTIYVIPELNKGWTLFARSWQTSELGEAILVKYD